MLRVKIPLKRCVLDTTLCDQVWQWLAAGQWFSPVTPVPSTNKSNLHDILVTEILLKVALNIITITITPNKLKQNNVTNLYTIKCSIAPHSSQCSTVFQMCPVFTSVIVTSYSFCQFFTNSLSDFFRGQKSLKIPKE